MTNEASLNATQTPELLNVLPYEKLPRGMSSTGWGTLQILSSCEPFPDILFEKLPSPQFLMMKLPLHNNLSMLPHISKQAHASLHQWMTSYIYYCAATLKKMHDEGPLNFCGPLIMATLISPLVCSSIPPS